MKKYRATQVIKVNLADHYESDNYPTEIEATILRVREKTYDIVYKDENNISTVITIGEFEILE